MQVREQTYLSYNTYFKNGTRITVYNKSYEANDSVFSKIIVNKITDDSFFQKEITLPHVEASHPEVQAIDDKNIIVAWKKDNKKIYYQWVKTDQIQEPATESKRTNATSIANIHVKPEELVSNIDPVCGMHLDEIMLGDTTLYQKNLYGFCNGHCKNMFVKAPKRYVP